MALQQTLKNLCSKSGWCYAVFWKVKRRSRMVLTWEDVYYELQSPDGGGNLRLLDSGGTSGCRGSSLHETSYSQRQIGLAVAKMSYCVYFMGEGIIGRVAFTGKHQWVFADGERSLFGTVFGSAPNNQCVLEKYPSSWEVQFAAGIKTIAIIAVQQGVVQLGSTEMIPESIQWVDHVKSAFGTLQNLQGALVASEGQGRVPSGCLSTGMRKAIPSQSSAQGTVDAPATRFQSLSAYGANQSMVGASVQSNLQGLSPPSEPSQPLLSMVRKGEIVQACNVEMGSMGIGTPVQGSETVSTASDVVPIPNSQTHLVYEGVKRDFHHGDIWGIHPTLATDRLRSDLLTTFHEQRGVSPQSKTMHPGSFLPLNASGEQNLHHVQDASLAASNPSVNISVSEFARVPNNLAGVAAGSQGSFVGKGCEVQGFLADSVLLNVSPKTSYNGISHTPYSANPLSMSEDAEDKNVIVGGWDIMDTYLASFTQGQISNRDCSFGLGDELSQALGPCFYSKDKNPLDRELTIVAADQLKSGKLCPLSDLSASEQMPAWVSGVSKSEVQFSESKSESLLDAVVASASSSHFSIQIAEEDSLSCRTFSAKDGGSSAAKVPKTTSIKHASSHSSQNCMSQSMLHRVPLDCEVSLSNQAFSAVLHDPLSFSTSSTCPPLKMIRSSCTEDIQSMRSDSTQASQLKKSDDPAHKPTRKRARPGESARPRPKDRQQIQDRVRELREIVPNGSKCSIDALLEKTIKHMLFLQNVTLHADNLKKNGELKDDVENGASWALELGGDDTGRPPILVKNLNQPRQFLVEMFCEEKGHFLEIADIIRSLGLTILKGVMESRSDKIWARFVVEANRDIRRVDIMMPLMHLLHVNNKSGSSMTIGSQTAPLRSHIGLECSSSSQSQSASGFPQSSSLHV